MKNSTYLIILLALGLVFVSYKWISTASVDCDAAVSAQTSPASSTYEDIMTRASVRAYSDRAVSGAAVDSLLKTAMAAPTAGNKQPWRFVVVRDRKTLDYIGDNFNSMTMMKQAPLAVVVCGELAATFPDEGVGYWIQDTSAATENLLLAAHAIGLGAVWCGVYPMSDHVKKFSELLHLPEGIVPLNCIAIGYPSVSPSPKNKWNPEYVHYESY